MSDGFQAIEALVEQLKAADWKERDALKDALVAQVRTGDLTSAVNWLTEARKGLALELRWEIDEVLERLEPEPEPEPEPDAEEEAPKDGQLSAADLVLVYDDPRGLALHKSKVGERWFATQVDPRTRQPQTFELHAQEIGQLKQQLAGSPYWVLGAGA